MQIYIKRKYIYVSWLQRGALQADPSEWETVTAEARRHDRFWLNDKLKETHVSTLRVDTLFRRNFVLATILAKILAYQPYWIKYFQWRLGFAEDEVYELIK